MKRLYYVDNCEVYWVIAEDTQEVKTLLEAQEEFEPFGEMIDIREVKKHEAQSTSFRFEGEEEECSMWMAYMLIRDHASCILACSEW